MKKSRSRLSRHTLLGLCLVAVALVLLDGARIYNRALSASEVQQLYQAIP